MQNSNNNLGIFLAMLGLFFLQITRAQSVNDQRLAGIEATINKILADHHAAGVAVAVVEKNKVVYARGFGYRDIEKKLPVTPSTQFAIGSCTKAFTAALLGILQKEYSLDFDKPVTTYLPQQKFYSNELTNQITLRDMMSHRTGLPRHDLSWYIDPDTREALTKRVQYMEPSAPLRQRFQYNNFMFLLQGVVAEKVTGKKWETNISSRIFNKIGMRQSNFSVKDLANYAEPAVGYDVKHDSVIHRMKYYDIDGMGPAGSINSTVQDMAQWLRVWINGGKYNDSIVVPANYFAEAISSQMIVAPGTPTPEKPDIQFSNYGFGWFLVSYKGHYRVEHGGNIDGFSASTSFYPSDSIGIVVLCNQNGSAVPSAVRNLITDKLLKLPAFDWNADFLASKKKAKDQAQQAEKSFTSGRVSNTQPSHPLASYVGKYSNDAYGSFEVIQKGDSLFAKLKQQQWWLQQFHYDIFLPFDTEEGIDTTDKSPIRFQFTTGLKGDIETASLFGFEPALPSPIIFSRANNAISVTEASLKKYVGEFLLSGITIKTYIKGSSLYVFVPGQPEYELMPVSNHRFDFKTVKGFSVLFDMDEKNQPAGLTFIQPNGNFRAAKK
jgi:CubicO group peptidase (beta-lactamase class C family)